MANTLVLTRNPLIYATCQCLPTTSTTEKNKLVAIDTSLADPEVHFTTHPWFPGTTIGATPTITAHASADDAVVITMVTGHPSEIEVVPLECPEGMDLSEVQVYFTANGRTRS